MHLSFVISACAQGTAQVGMSGGGASRGMAATRDADKKRGTIAQERMTREITDVREYDLQDDAKGKSSSRCSNPAIALFIHPLFFSFLPAE